MKLLLLLVTSLTLSNRSCNKSVGNTGCYRGKLEIAGSCSNYTIKLLKGNLDTTLIAAQWTNEYTGKHYTDVFALGNPCKFPESIKEGDEFYFTVDTTGKNDCITCLIFYPKPEKSLPIRVLDKPCKP